MGEGHGAVDALELRVVQVQSALDVGMTEIKGSLALLVQAADYTKQELERRDRERAEDLAAQAEKDKDQESRIRALEQHVGRVVGVGAGAGIMLSTAVGVVLHFWK